jgi:amidase
MKRTRAAGPPHDPYGAFCVENHVALEGVPDGALTGLTFAVKDVFHISGYKTGFGHPDWLRTHPSAKTTSPMVQRLLDEGACMVGKTRTDELTYSLTGENLHYGTPINPVAPNHIPGGSSSGSASAVAGGLVDFALGTDCAGSVRLPASYCGILGIRPTHGRVSLDGAIALAPSFDVAGWFARDANVFERVGLVLLGDGADARPPVRLLYALDAFDLVESQVADVLEDAVGKAANLIGGHEELSVSTQGLAEWFETFRVLQAAEIWSNHGAWIERENPKFGRGIDERLEWASKVRPEQVTEGKERHAAIRARIEEVIQEGDVLCLPTSPRTAPFKEMPTDQIEVRYRHQAMCLLCIAGLGGLPQVNLPLVTLEGLPLGLSLVGPRGTDLQLLSLTRRLMERAKTGAA